MRKSEEQEAEDASLPDHQVAIVGGGIAGLYAAYRLLQHFEKQPPAPRFRKARVAVYEATSRVGGRICTVRVAHDGELVKKSDASDSDGYTRSLKDVEFIVEFGPMRIEPDQQLLLKKLMEDLEIVRPPKGQAPDTSKPHLIDFPAYASPKSEHDPVFELKDDEARAEDPLELMKLAFMRIFGQMRADRLSAAHRQRLHWLQVDYQRQLQVATEDARLGSVVSRCRTPDRGLSDAERLLVLFDGLVEPATETGQLRDAGATLPDKYSKEHLEALMDHLGPLRGKLESDPLARALEFLDERIRRSGNLAKIDPDSANLLREALEHDRTKHSSVEFVLRQLSGTSPDPQATALRRHVEDLLSLEARDPAGVAVVC